MTPEGFAMMPRWLQRDPNVSAAAKLVYLALSSRAGRSGESWPKHATIALEASCSVATVKRALVELRGLGVIEWDTRLRPNGTKTANRYRLVFPDVETPVDNSDL